MKAKTALSTDNKDSILSTGVLFNHEKPREIGILWHRKRIMHGSLCEVTQTSRNDKEIC